MTHYDTLKVTQDAPIEVISAAYKALARIYHPDTNSTNPETMLIMQNINVAYKILSDPLKRSEHDLWIRSQERRSESKTSDKQRRASPSGDLKAKVDKAMAEASKWAAWTNKAVQEAKEAKDRAEKAAVDLARAAPGDRAKWEAWVNKTAQEAKEAAQRADKATAQSEQATAEAAAIAEEIQLQKAGDK